jgi:ribosome-binding ATPase
LKDGITGLPYSGKTTLFCALTGQKYETLAHGRDIHPGTVSVPDKRLDTLNEMFLPKKKTPATMEYFDIAGKPAAESKGMDPAILQVLKSADALMVVVDAFSPDADPQTDFTAVVEEFALNDLIVATTRLERLERELRSKKEDRLVREKELIEKCRERLETGARLVGLDLSEAEEKSLRGFQFLTRKPLIIVINISEDDLAMGNTSSFE